jgi:7-keto-8-aminopelargonate synthetase-like enzyme
LATRRIAKRHGLIGAMHRNAAAGGGGAAIDRNAPPSAASNASRLAPTGLQRKGYDIRAIRPPTVPEGTARLRIALTLNVDQPTVAGLFEALSEDLRKAA